MMEKRLHRPPLIRAKSPAGDLKTIGSHELLQIPPLGMWCSANPPPFPEGKMSTSSVFFALLSRLLSLRLTFSLLASLTSQNHLRSDLFLPSINQNWHAVGLRCRLRSSQHRNKFLCAGFFLIASARHNNSSAIL